MAVDGGPDRASGTPTDRMTPSCGSRKTRALRAVAVERESEPLWMPTRRAAATNGPSR